MKRLILICVLIFIASGCAPTVSCSDDSECTQILFIGNSYTSVNDLPGTLTRLINSSEHRIEATMIAPGGWFLADHVKSAETINLINSQKWDFVVLQEQSQVPASIQMRATQTYPAARTLVGNIKANGSTPMLFITWAHRDGWPEQNIPTYEKMQLAIDDGYTTIGQELKVRMSPVGFAWLKMRQQNPQMNLWQDDGSHPNEMGTYLAACVFYASIFHESPEGLSYKGGLSKEDAKLLQQTAASAVLDYASYWNIP